MSVFSLKLAELSVKENLTPCERAALESCDPEDIARVCDDTMPLKAKKAKKAKK